MYERSVGENERLMTLLVEKSAPLAREQWSISSIASFRHNGRFDTDGLETVFRNAWFFMRFQHPSLASFEDSGKLKYLVPDTKTLEQWSCENFKIAPAGKSANDIIAKFRPTKTAKLYYIPETSQLVLNSSHWRTDGFGTLMIFNDFFEAAATITTRTIEQLAWGEEVKRLAPSVEEALDMPNVLTPETKATADKCAATFGLYSGCVGIQFDREKTLPQGTRTVQVQLSLDTTCNIIDACKTRGLGVTSALQSSLAAANYLFASPEDQSKHFASTARFSFRPYLPEPYGTSVYAAGLYTSGWIHGLSASQTWEESAAELTKVYKEPLSQSFMEAYPQYGLNMQRYIQNVPPDAPPLSNVDISNVGGIDDMVQPIHRSQDIELEITNITVGVETLTPQIVVFVWTFRGHLNIFPVYNEAFHKREYVQKFVETLKAILLQNLEIVE
ncbi:MAG: hypothetical protein M1828_000483 [Chrysothrix sp. TS-e1954]|nr:MAG: hypothetical protein M1828_000483 [Chrysothrix sp. TS-e1954]